MAFRTIARRAYSCIPKIDLNGIFIPLTTPFGENQDINYKGLKSNLEAYEKIPFTGYVVAGSNGESPYLTPQERIDLVKFVRENTSRDKVVIGGSTAESTRLTSEITVEMKKVGADGVLVMLPFYFKKRMTEAAILEHYTAVADTGALPVVIYNMPVVTGIDIGIPLLAKLAKHPLIRGVKDSDIRKCAGTVLDTKEDNFDVLIGSAGYLLGALLGGCSGAINGLAGILGNELCQIYQLVRKEKKFEEASKLQILVSKPDILLLSEMGVPGLKAAMDLMGFVGGACRKPILSPTEIDVQKIESALKEARFL